MLKILLVIICVVTTGCCDNKKNRNKNYQINTCKVYDFRVQDKYYGTTHDGLPIPVGICEFTNRGRSVQDSCHLYSIGDIICNPN